MEWGGVMLIRVYSNGIKNLFTKIYIATTLFLFPAVFLVSADQVTIYATRYKLRQYADADDQAGSENTTSTAAQPCGMFHQYSGVQWDSEILCDFDLSGIPNGSTIDYVDYGYNVFATSVGTDNVEIFVCNRAWTAPVTYDDLGRAGEGA